MWMPDPATRTAARMWWWCHIRTADKIGSGCRCVSYRDPFGLCPEWKTGEPCIEIIDSPMRAAESTEPSGVGGSEYGFTRSGGNQWHNGFDWAADMMTPVRAPTDLTVTAQYDNKSGHYVQMRWGEYQISVLHLSENALGLSPGQSTRVKAGAVVGYVGRTGNAGRSPRETHGHVITRVSGHTCNPREFFSSTGGGSCQ